MINLWGLISTIIVFEICKKLKLLKFFSKIPPMMMASLFLIIVLCVFKIDYKSYNESSCFLTLLLGPATVALALPLSDNATLLTKNKRAVYFGFVVAVVIALITTVVLGHIFHSDWKLITSLIPKTVTTPIAVEISKAIGGIPELTACLVCLTGIYGAMFSHKILKIFKIKSDIATGLSIGATSHVLGTSTCIEKKREKQVVMATLALIIIGILTTLVCVLFF
ncbi:MAG: LrgB family protein [Candidatus Gastranaerophilales bacterium]|nr:LrgB family protein [Candidatus Gastranaerophilales bacterium]